MASFVKSFIFFALLLLLQQCLASGTSCSTGQLIAQAGCLIGKMLTESRLMYPELLVVTGCTSKCPGIESTVPVTPLEQYPTSAATTLPGSESMVLMPPLRQYTNSAATNTPILIYQPVTSDRPVPIKQPVPINQLV